MSQNGIMRTRASVGGYALCFATAYLSFRTCYLISEIEQKASSPHLRTRLILYFHYPFSGSSFILDEV